MTEIVKTADGKITFRKDEFKAMSVRLPATVIGMTQHEVVVWTDTWDGGRIFGYNTAAEAHAAAKEIQDQL